MIWLLFFAMAWSQERLDPHGMRSEDIRHIHNDQNCLVCHKDLKKYQLYPEAEKRCSDCHNKAPHSGIEEHRSLNCLSCHRAHRNEMPSEVGTDDTVKRQSLFMVHFKHKLNEKSHWEKSSMPMLKKSCTDCHGAGKW